MSMRRAIPLTIAVAAIVVAVLVLRWYLPGRLPYSPSPAPSGPGLNFTIALDRDQGVGTTYGARRTGIPITVLIDGNGIIRGKRVGAFPSQQALMGWLDDVTASEAPSPLPGTVAEVGYMAPDFTLAVLGGGTVTLSQLGDRWVLLNFWATWCPYCVRQMPYFQAAFEEKGDEIEFIGINWGETEGKVRQYIGG